MTSYGDTWAGLYDPVHTLTEDIPFWVEEAKASGGPVLELGCGTGRVAMPIAEAGIPVVGLDSSAEMLRLARAKARRAGIKASTLRFVRADMRSFSLGQRFPLVIVPFRSFQLLLSVADQCQALAAIRKHLVPGGKLIISLFVPDPELMTRDPSVPFYDHEAVEPASGHRFLVWHQDYYDTFSQVVNARTIIEELDQRGETMRRAYLDYQMRYLYRFEAQHLLATCGYQVLDVYGSFLREPLDELSTEMVWIATSPGVGAE